MLQRTDWSRLPQSAGSIFARYNREALRHHALNLAQGFPDFPPQARLLEALERTARLPQSHQYGPPEGVPAGPYFAHLATLAKAAGLSQLSMGMSADFEVAIAMGATQVRVGSALFGARPAPPATAEDS